MMGCQLLHNLEFSRFPVMFSFYNRDFDSNIALFPAKKQSGGITSTVAPELSFRALHLLAGFQTLALSPTMHVSG